MPDAVRCKLDALDEEILREKYEMLEVLGEGTYGTVFRARSLVSGAEFAIKKLRNDKLKEGVPATTLREVTLLHEMSDNPNVVQLLDVVCSKRRVYLVFELLNEDLRAFIRRHCPKPPATVSGSVVPLDLVKNFTRQMLHALWRCHQNRIIHRDLKPANVLIGVRKPSKGEDKGSYILKLADFGLARTYELPLLTYTKEVMTLWYRAPEILLGERHYTPAADVWSLGCIVLEMIVGCPIFRGESNRDQLDKIFYTVGTPTEEVWKGVAQMPGYDKTFKIYKVAPLHERLPTFDKEAIKFVSFLLEVNPKSRPTIPNILKHPFLQSD
uniref:Putative cdc2-related kinase n=1 Tax=Trypanosoma congolense (strain IL3000) TaxID=1068625 RepID=G0UZB0_TRYCI|nr:putative cdc2-related kinase [Trypanosoma congolense IL3000]